MGFGCPHCLDHRGIFPAFPFDLDVSGSEPQRALRKHLGQENPTGLRI